MARTQIIGKSIFYTSIWLSSLLRTHYTVASIQLVYWFHFNVLLIIMDIFDQLIQAVVLIIWKQWRNHLRCIWFIIVSEFISECNQANIEPFLPLVVRLKVRKWICALELCIAYCILIMYHYSIWYRTLSHYVSGIFCFVYFRSCVVVVISFLRDSFSFVMNFYHRQINFNSYSHLLDIYV